MKKSILILMVGALLATWSEGRARPTLELIAGQTVAAR
jgi:hypothetical protein